MNTRKAEVLVNGYWEERSFIRIGRKAIFRLFEEDGTEVDHGQVCVAEEPAQKTKEGIWGVKCRPLGEDSRPANPKEGMIIWLDGSPYKFSGGEWNNFDPARKEAR